MSFRNLLWAEWTKLRTVRRWLITIAMAMLFTVGFSALISTSASTDLNERPFFVTGPDGEPVADSFQFVYQPISGDATVTVHVDTVKALTFISEGNDEGLKPVADTPWTGVAAGVMIKAGTTPGSPYVSVLLNPTQGVRMQAAFTSDIAGSTGNTSRWLRLTRAGASVTGYESADGANWNEIGTMQLPQLPAAAQAGFYVSAADIQGWSRGMGSSSLGMRPGQAKATFDHPTLTPGGDAWTVSRVKMPHELVSEKADATSRRAGDDPNDRGTGTDISGQDTDDSEATKPRAATADGLTVNDGVYTVIGSGKIGPEPALDDMVSLSLIGVIAGLLTLIPVSVLFATSEFRKGMIRTTFTAEPRRGRVLAAKTTVLGTLTFVLSLAALVASFLIAMPQLRKHGFAPPAFPTPGLTDPGVVRVLLLSALFMAAVAVFALGLGMLLRRSAPAITIAVALFVLPFIAGMLLPGESPKFLMYTTLAGGLATQRLNPPTQLLAEPWAMIGPWAAIIAALAYAAAATGLAWWRGHTQDLS